MSGKGKPFEPGNKHGKGRPKMPVEIKGLANLTKAEATAALSGVLKLNLEELELLVKDKTIPSLTQWAARIVLHGIKQGDQQRLNFMFDRLIGKVVDKVEHKSIEPFIIIRPSGEQVLLGARIKGEEE